MHTTFSAASTAALRKPDSPGAWHPSLRYVWSWAHGVETVGLLGLPLVGLIAWMWTGAAPTWGETALLGVAFAGLGPFFQAMHRLGNPPAAHTPTVRQLTYATMALGALLPFGAQSVVGIAALATAIAALARAHRDRNRAWVRSVVAEELRVVGEDATATDQLGAFLARLADRGLTLTSVTPASWRALAEVVHLAVSDAELTAMLEAFVTRYNGILQRSLEQSSRRRGLSSAEIVDGLGAQFALAAVDSASHYPPATAEAPSLEALTGSLRSHDAAQRSP